MSFRACREISRSLHALRLVEMTKKKDSRDDNAFPVISTVVEKSQRIMSKRYYTYILANKTDTTLYIGVTNNLERRVAEHRSGLIPGFTQKYNCHKLVYFEEYSDVEQAIAREKQLKKWSRSKKDWLIDTMNKERSDLMPYEQ